MRTPPFLWERNLFFLEKKAGCEHGHGAKKPLNTPQLYRLPIEQRGSGKNKAGDDGGYYAGESHDQGHERRIGLSERFTQRSKIDPGIQAGHRIGSQIGVAVCAADIAEARSQNKVRTALLTYLLDRKSVV